MKNKKKLLVVLACLALCVCTVVTGTLAWLTDKTETVTNTFTTSNIDIELTENAGTLNGTNREFKMVPGDDIAKDPRVVVKANSEACWLFVKVEKSPNFATYLTYAMADGWTPLTGVDGVYYRQVATSTVDQDFNVLKDNQVVVNTTVTSQQMTEAKTSVPSMSFIAYAVQSANVETAADAWTIAAGLQSGN